MDSSNIGIAFLGAIFSVSIVISIVSLIVAGITRLFHIKPKRPALITVICAFWAWVIIGIVQRVISSLSLAQLPVNLVYPLALMISIVGIWKMKMWGLYLLFFTFFVVQVAHVFMHQWSILSLTYFLFVLPVFLYYRRMK